MEVFEAMRTRASVRDFRPDPIGRGQMEKLKEAALLAPTSLNLQEQKFCFVTDAALLRKMTEGVIEVSKERGETDYLERLALRGGKVFFGAPLVIVIAVNPENNYIDVDAGIAAQNLALAADLRRQELRRRPEQRDYRNAGRQARIRQAQRHQPRCRGHRPCRQRILSICCSGRRQGED